MKKKKRAPAKGSRRWYEAQWKAVLSGKEGPVPSTLPKQLAQLSYDFQKVVDRTEALEDAYEEMEERFYTALHAFSVNLNHLGHVMELSERRRDGMVRIEGTPHLRECARVMTPGSTTCTCGSQPEKPN